MYGLVVIVADKNAQVHFPNIKCQMSKTFIGGAVCREFESEVPAAEEMLD